MGTRPRTDQGSERRLVQCKRWTSNRVGVNEVRAFAGTLMREGINGSHGEFVTLSTFYQQAQEEAAKIGMTLVDGRNLYQREKARRSEPCPICSEPMLLDRSAHGWWLRCAAAGCADKRHLDADPGRAVDLLTQPPMRAATPIARE